MTELSPWIKSRLQTIYSSLVDITIILSTFFISNKIELSSTPKSSYALFCIILVWILSSYIIGRYTFNQKRKSYTILKQVVLSIFSCLICCSLYLIGNLFLKDSFILVNNNSILIILSFIIIFISSISQIKLFTKDNVAYAENWIFIGNSSTYVYLSNLLDSKKISINLNKIDLIDTNLLTLKASNTKGIVVENINDIDKSYYKNILILKDRGIEIISIMNWAERILECCPNKLIEDSYLILDGFSFPKESLQLRVKRIGDFSFSLFLIIITLPIVLISSILIYLEDKGPILYSQIRTGYGGKLFRIYKLRSMKVNAEEEGAKWSKRGDKRITRIGNILRKLRIDELPQLWCVLTGQMSLIGPRPERPEFDEDLEKQIPYYNYRYFIRPGLSGWAQVNYPYGARIEDSRNKLSYDFFYIRNFSTLLDLVILMKTMRLVFNAKGSIAVSK